MPSDNKKQNKQVKFQSLCIAEATINKMKNKNGRKYLQTMYLLRD
jgi:hypothetical protein